MNNNNLNHFRKKDKLDLIDEIKSLIKFQI